MDTRTSKAVKNIAASMLLKGGSIAISLLLVPLTLSYLNEYEYGVWLTLSSVLSWIYILDIGLGNGLRNKLTEAIALDDLKLAKIYVSTTFYSLTFIVIVIYAVFWGIHQCLDWNVILNTDPQKVDDINSIVSIVFAFFCTSFVLKTIGNIYMAYQQPAVNDLLLFLGNLVSLILVYICTLIYPGSLEKVAVLFSASPVLVYLVAFPVTFFKYKKIRPSFAFVRLEYLKHLMSLGGQFFIIQISSLIVFMTSNFIISQLFGPAQVTPFNIAFRYFSVVNMGFTIVLTPFWSAVTDAYTKNDMDWIRNTLRKIIVIWIGSVCATILMVIFSSFVYSLWVGKDIMIPFVLSIVCGIYVTIANWNNIFAYMLNGIGKIRLQLYSSIVSGLLFFPLAYYFGEKLGITGVMVAMCSCLFISSVWSPIQFGKILSGKATGIWFK